MTSDDRYYELLKTARCYYEEGKTQQLIADELKLSRPTVAKYLREAKATGMVEIRVIDIRNKSRILDLENALRERFGLEYAKVVETPRGSDASLKESLGDAAARYLERLVKNGVRIGVSWGTTVKATVAQLRENLHLHDVEAVTLVGGASKLDSTIHANVLCERIAERFGGISHYLYAPAIVDADDVAAGIRASVEIDEVLTRARMVDIALVGIGSPDEYSSIVRTGYFSRGDLRELLRFKVVGDICTRFYDANGNVPPLTLNRRIVGVELSDLREIPHVIGVAGGPKKVRAIVGALKARFVTALVTDSATAHGVLKEVKNMKDNKYEATRRARATRS